MTKMASPPRLPIASPVSKRSTVAMWEMRWIVDPTSQLTIASWTTRRSSQIAASAIATTAPSVNAP
jgi:hypothetical protein